MSNDRLSYFDDNAPTIGSKLSHVQSVFNNIRKKAKVIEVIGDF